MAEPPHTTITRVQIDMFNNLQRPSFYVPARKKVETKKQRIARIAKERMLASWKTHNQIAPRIFEVKQICKPIHRLIKK